MDEVSNHTVHPIVRVLICDDHHLIRQALRAVIEGELDMEVVGEAADGEDAVAKAADLRPDAVIMDIQMPKLSGIEATRRIKEMLPNAIILVLTVHDSNEHVLRILGAGASGYLTKSIISDEIPTAIRAATRGECILSENILKTLVQYVSGFPTTKHFSQAKGITVRELEVLRLVANGLSNKAIALSLDLSENTIKKYMMSIFVKLGVTSRTEAISYARKLNLLDLVDNEL